MDLRNVLDFTKLQEPVIQIVRNWQIKCIKISSHYCYQNDLIDIVTALIPCLAMLALNSNANQLRPSVCSIYISERSRSK